MNTLENNKLIAEFMGLKPNPYNQDPLHPTDFAEDGDKCIKYSDMKYHTSWDWLMPVVEKIVGIRDESGDTRFSVKLIGWWTSILDKHTEELIAIYGLDKLDTTYRAVVSFIKKSSERPTT